MMLKQPQIFKLSDTIFKNQVQHTGAVRAGVCGW